MVQPTTNNQQNPGPQQELRTQLSTWISSLEFHNQTASHDWVKSYLEGIMPEPTANNEIVLWARTKIFEKISEDIDSQRAKDDDAFAVNKLE